MNNKHSEMVLGLDLGTSGLRASLVKRKPTSTSSLFPDSSKDKILAQTAISFDATSETGFNQVPDTWSKLLDQLLTDLAEQINLNQVDAIIADATSSTVMLCDVNGCPASEALMYNDSQATSQANYIAEFIAEYEQEYNTQIKTAAIGASSSLAKALYLYQSIQQINPNSKRLQIVHQIDWLNNFFVGFLQQGNNFSDENNLLKLGYDPELGDYQDWLRKLLDQIAPKIVLPQVGIPGHELAVVSNDIVHKYGFNQNCKILFGTTDSTAGFFASGASQLGDGVSSLGSTLAVKRLINKPVFDAKFGLYSHKVGPFWLVGGASNSGGKVILDYYTLDEIKSLEAICQAFWSMPPEENDPHLNKIHQKIRTCTNYYPLGKKGERFPIADVAYSGRLPAIPTSSLNTGLMNSLLESVKKHDIDRLLSEIDKKSINYLLEHIQFFSGLVQGLTHIEKLSYDLINQYSPEAGNIYAVGGGTQNGYWQILRQAYLQNPLQSPFSLEASYGVTRLAKNT